MPHGYAVTPEEWEEQRRLQAAQARQKGGGGPSPMMMQQFMGGGQAGAGQAAAGGSGGSSGGMMASAGPWAALAAGIAYNENKQRKEGNRPSSKSKQLKEGLTGEALQRDAKKYGDKIGGPLGKATEILGQAGNPRGLGRLLEKGLKPWEWF